MGLALTVAFAPHATETGAAAPAARSVTDPLRPPDPNSPPWLSAVGMLQVPGIRYREGYPRHHREDCSATLVGRTHGKAASFILTAWHCLADYRDLSQRISFTLMPGSAQSQTREAVRVADGGGMHADWALLRLTAPVPVGVARPLAVSRERGNPELAIAMAGFSRNPGEDRGARQLSHHPRCRITAQRAGTTASDCAARKGTSGGAVIQPGTDSPAALLGVISEGDGAGVSIFVPTAVFLAEIESYLAD